MQHPLKTSGLCKVLYVHLGRGWREVLLVPKCFSLSQFSTHLLKSYSSSSNFWKNPFCLGQKRLQGQTSTNCKFFATLLHPLPSPDHLDLQMTAEQNWTQEGQMLSKSSKFSTWTTTFNLNLVYKWKLLRLNHVRHWRNLPSQLIPEAVWAPATAQRP